MNRRIKIQLEAVVDMAHPDRCGVICTGLTSIDATGCCNIFGARLRECKGKTPVRCRACLRAEVRFVTLTIDPSKAGG